MKIKIPKLKTREEFLAYVDSAARITVEVRSMEAARDRRIQQIQDEYAGALDAQKSQLTAIVAQAEKFAEEHQCELMLGKARSAETALARYGFRTGMPQLKTLAKWTWEKALGSLLERRLYVFVRTNREIDKAAILAASANGLADVDNPLSRTPLADIGLRVVQQESFYIDPKVDGAEHLKSGARSTA
jgi:phage host-nuclease inhibitor protein Gam